MGFASRGWRRWQDEQRVGGRIDARPEDPLAGVLEEPVAQRPQRRTPRADPQEPGALRLPGPAQGRVDGIREGTGVPGDIGEEQVGVGVPEQCGDRVVVGQGESVARAAGDDVDGVTDVEEVPVRRVDLPVRPVGEPGPGERPEHRHVPQAAAGLLQVRLDQMGQLPVPGVPRGHRLGELGQPGPQSGAPVLVDGRPGRRDELRVAGEIPQVEQADRRCEVGLGDLPALGDGADGVVQAGLGVPHRVPDPVGKGDDLGGRQRRRVMDEDEVEVTERTAVAPRKAAHGGQREPGSVSVADCLTPHLGYPRLEVCRQPLATRLAGTGDGEVAGAGEVEPTGVQVPPTARLRGHRAHVHRCGRARRPPPGRPRPCHRRSVRSALR